MRNLAVGRYLFALKKKRFLVVDDNANIIEVLCLILTGLGFLVDSFEDSSQALCHFRSHSSEYQGIFTDLAMPSLTGEQLVKEVRIIQKTIPIVIVSAYIPASTRISLKKFTINKYIEKPFSMEEIAMAAGLM